MKKLTLIIPLLLLLLVGGCVIDPPCPQDEVPCISDEKEGLKVRLYQHHPTYVWSVEATMTFDSVLQDSRCPLNAFCVWEGEVEIGIWIDPGRQPAFYLTIKNTDDGKYFSVRGKEYFMKLLEVEPYPGSGKKHKPYATVEIYRVCDDCDLEPDPGPCDGAFPRYYYDKEDNMCKEFIWGGCGGVVPFDTFDECKACVTE